MTVVNQEQNGNRVDPDETAHYELSHMDQYCLQKVSVLVFRAERVKSELWLIHKKKIKL